MTYDYYGAWDNVTGINAPLYAKDFLDENDDGRWKNVVSYNKRKKKEGLIKFFFVDFCIRIIQCIIGYQKVVQQKNLI